MPLIDFVFFFFNTESAPQFLVRSMDDITLDDTQVKLSGKELRLLGYQTPKRKSDSSLEGTAKKFGPFDL